MKWMYLVLINEAKAYIGGRIELLFMLFDEQIQVLQEYNYVETELIERTWDKHIEFMSYYMGVSKETYQILREFYLDGCVKELNIDTKEDLLDYLVYKKVGRQITDICKEKD